MTHSSGRLFFTRAVYIFLICCFTSVKSEIAALDSVLAEYRLGLENGELDPEEYLPKFIQALREAGIEKVIAEKQRQLDSWVAEK